MTEEPTRRKLLSLCASGAALGVAGCASRTAPTADRLRSLGSDSDDEDDEDGDIDDWIYDPDAHLGSRSGGPTGPVAHSQPEGDMATDDAESIGLAAGGAADVGTFRRNVYEDFLPIPETLAYEGLFHEYYFDTGGDGSCSELFCPTYTPAIAADPLAGETERFVTVGLNSGLAKDDFERPPLNLVIVLDVSGSMNASFDRYYYDQFGNKQEAEGDVSTAKMEVAKDVLIDFTEHLRPDDRFGVVLFNHESAIAKPVSRVGDTDMDAIRNHIRDDVWAGGGTNISAAMEDAEALLDEVIADDGEPGGEASREYEYRSILLTDAQINWGETDADELRSSLEARAERRMHTSVVGIGVDFNADLINQITAVRGANYYSVYSTDQFEQRMLEEFEYMVTPLVYDLSLELDSSVYDIKQVYGSPDADQATGELMHVNTLFPSPSSDGEAKGGVVLVELERIDTGEGTETDSGPFGGYLELEASWEERDGRTDSTVESVSLPAEFDEEYWGNDAIRKAVLLARHANLLIDWMVDEREEVNRRDIYDGEEPEGIEPPRVALSEWELQSQSLSVSPDNAERFEQFRGHLEAEMEAIGDEDLKRELELIDAILEAPSEQAWTTP